MSHQIKRSIAKALLVIGLIISALLSYLYWSADHISYQPDCQLQSIFDCNHINYRFYAIAWTATTIALLVATILFNKNQPTARSHK